MVYLAGRSGRDELSQGPPGEEPWLGRWRPSLATNTLFAGAHTALGRVQPKIFANPPPSKVFGIKFDALQEGAKQVTMVWRSHQPNPHAKPPPDYKAMNKIAVDSGLSSTRGLRSFREQHTVLLKCGQAAAKAPPLPSEKDPNHTYGLPPRYRSAEECRNAGPADPPTKQLVGGAYAWEWVAMNKARAAELDAHAGYIKPAPTRATEGHRRGAELARAKTAPAGGGWKLPRFTRVAPRVTAYMGGQQQAAAQHAEAEEAAGGGPPM